ncbi:MAG: hypothetical protein AB1726_18760 [Planctomycetota bacterium]
MPPDPIQELKVEIKRLVDRVDRLVLPNPNTVLTADEIAAFHKVRDVLTARTVGGVSEVIKITLPCTPLCYICQWTSSQLPWRPEELEILARLYGQGSP